MEQNGWNASRMAAAVHVNKSTVTRALALLDLPEELQVAIERGQVSPSTALEIAQADDPDHQRVLTAQVADQGLSREAVRTSVEHGADPAPDPASPRPLRRVFRTSTGRVTVTINRDVANDRDAYLATLIEFIELVSQEAQARS